MSNSNTSTISIDDDVSVSEAHESEHGVPIQVGISVASMSAPLQVPDDVVEKLKDDEGRIEAELYDALADWWDSLSVTERAEQLSLAKKNGNHLTENLFAIDEVDENGHGQPIREY